mgnify:CR=1 FL=1
MEAEDREPFFKLVFEFGKILNFYSKISPEQLEIYLKDNNNIFKPEHFKKYFQTIKTKKTNERNN